MRPQHCPQGHALVWLNPRLAVCEACDDNHFIYHHTGPITRFAQLIQRFVPAQEQRPAGLQSLTRVPQVALQPVPITVPAQQRAR